MDLKEIQMRHFYGTDIISVCNLVQIQIQIWNKNPNLDRVNLNEIS